MKDIAVITAHNPLNAGMLSVDLAAEDFLRKHGATFDIFKSHNASPHSNSSFAGQPTTPLHDPNQLRDYSTILYWGDFLNSPLYGIHDFTQLDIRHGHSRTNQEALEKWKRLFLLKNYHRSHQRVISAGNNFQGLSACRQLLSPQDWEEIVRLYSSSFDAIFPRDPASTESLRTLLPENGRPTIQTGLDTAFLLNPAPLLKTRPPDLKRKHYRFFFGRSGLKGITMLRLALSVSKLQSSERLSGWFDIDPARPGRVQLGGLLDNIRHSSFIVTDTYHLCVNAMNLGVPVVGIGVNAADQDGTLGDYKKEALFKMLGKEKQYVSVSERRLGPVGIHRAIQSVSKAMNIDDTNNSTLHKARADFERILARALGL
ncbi:MULTISPECIES: polysaccharide pyruvyl transferase family protein [unclassified Thioalkalivibrio]|uniref:polysaccharide pyruvyl transferase family protein n=1 Tax=unclassified Thioalkalivibrio TaxID=2621013 RepID=UPI0003786366|nr:MULTISPECIES: polysaccharide pyruvyl transferase family protein [unclassified Thioalkalivibrio]